MNTGRSATMAASASGEGETDGLGRARVLPELLAPAGDWDCARAAVENGADAIYFGLGRFNARMRAQNFTEADLAPLMTYLHTRGVRGYVSFNTLVFADELAAGEDTLRSIIAAGVDAAIVQDVGVCRLIRKLSPDFPIHVSTQMTVTSAAGVAFARELGCQLVVLARECSIREIGLIQEALKCEDPAGASGGLPLEVFVHGALCVAYSGQCLTSESLGGRSANRGECAQACRMPYALVADGREVPLGERRYLLSPQDLCGLELLPDLVRLGIQSLKIEGRLKSPEYVASMTRVYRQALDRLAVVDSTPSEAVMAEVVQSTRYEVEMAFSRGIYTGWFRGVNHQELVHGRFGKKRGVYMGEVSHVRSGRVHVRLRGSLKPGDGVVFDAGSPEKEEEGGRVYSLDRRGDEAVLGFGQGDLNLGRVRPGDRVWKTSDPELERELRRSFAKGAPRYRQPLRMEVYGVMGHPLRIVARDPQGHVAAATSLMVLVRAERHALLEQVLLDHLGRLGGTPFQLERLSHQVEDGVMLPVSELNRLRREVVEDLLRQRAQPQRWALRVDSVLPWKLGEEADRSAIVPSSVVLRVLVRDLSQLEAAVGAGVKELYCELEDPKRYREAVRMAREAGGGVTLFVVPPRVFKPGEDWVLRQVRSSEPDGILVRNFDHLAAFAGARCVGDYTLNVANPIAAEYFMGRYRLERLTASYDLNSVQLAALLTSTPARWLEITIHQHMPMFHMEHCLFCAFLSKGTDYTNCGRPCDTRRLQLRDRVGALHPVRADAGCRNTVYNALAQTGAEAVPQLMQLGARQFRLEFLDETPEEVATTIRRYERLLRCEIRAADLWRELKLANRIGVTRGPRESAPNI